MTTTPAAIASRRPAPSTPSKNPQPPPLEPESSPPVSIRTETWERFARR